MSMLYDKNRFKFHPENEKTRMKNGNSLKNNVKKNVDKNPTLYKDYVYSSPIKNIINDNKKVSYINIHQNNSKISNNYDQGSKKSFPLNKLKYNRSFEGNKMNNDFMPDSNSEIQNDNLYTLNYNKHQAKNFNNKSVILNNKPKKQKNKYNNKSVTKSINSYGNSSIKNNNLNNNKNILIKKLDEKFKSLENNIIDKKYENYIDHDEIIISSNKKNNSKNKTANKIYDNNYKLSNIIGLNENGNEVNNNIKDNKSNEIEDDIFFNVIENKNNVDIDENYLLNSSFENNMSDFNIMYTSDYGNNVIDDMLSLEIKLMVEKMLELQKSYHTELNLILSQYNKNNSIFKILIEKIRELQKKKRIIENIHERKTMRGNIYNFVNIYNNNNLHETNKINKNEINLWKYSILAKDKKGNIYNKEKFREIFKKSIIDKYYKISGKMDNLENKIVLGLMKKFKYNNNNRNSEIKSNNSSSSKKCYDNQIHKIQSNKISSVSPDQQYKNMIRKNRNDNNTINNKKRHKKISSCGQANKQSKYINFKNLKK